jgi:competence protein ComEA
MRTLIASVLLILSLTFGLTPSSYAYQTDVPDILVVDVNTASAEEMATKLVGVGLVKARAIIEYRDEFGPFVVLDQLTEVNGIGERTIELNRERLRLTAVSDE